MPALPLAALEVSSRERSELIGALINAMQRRFCRTCESPGAHGRVIHLSCLYKNVVSGKNNCSRQFKFTLVFPVLYTKRLIL